MTRLVTDLKPFGLGFGASPIAAPREGVAGHHEHSSHAPLPLSLFRLGIGLSVFDVVVVFDVVLEEEEEAPSLTVSLDLRVSRN